MTHSIAVSTRDGFTVHALDDGRDYWSIIERFRAGTLDAREIRNRKPHVRRVFLVEAFGVKMVLKWEPNPESRLERRLWHMLHGPFLSTQMRQVTDALNNGCTLTQTIYLVAEKMRGRVCAESFWLGGYLPGSPLSDYAVQEEPASDPGPAVRCRREGGMVEVWYPDVRSVLRIRIPAERYDEIAPAMAELHSYKLALCDIHPSNILIDAEGIKFIDLNCRGLLCFNIAKDITRMRTRYGVVIAPSKFSNFLCCRYQAFLDFLRRKKRKLRRYLGSRAGSGKPGSEENENTPT